MAFLSGCRMSAGSTLLLITLSWLAKKLSSPDRVLGGQQEELLAIREIVPGKWLVVAYREVGEDGFVVTAYATRRARQLDTRIQIWP